MVLTTTEITMRALLMSVVLALVATGMASAIPSKAEGEGDADHKTRVLQKVCLNSIDVNYNDISEFSLSLV